MLKDYIFEKQIKINNKNKKGKEIKRSSWKLKSNYFFCYTKPN